MFFRRKKQKTLGSTRELVERPAFLLPEPPAPEISEDMWPATFSAPDSLKDTLKLPFFKFGRAVRAVLVHDADELTAAISAEQPQITLADDIALTESLLVDYDLTLNLADHSLLSEQTSADARVLDILHGHVTINGPGKIFTLSESGVVIRVFGAKNPSTPDYATLTVGAGVKLYSPDGTGIAVAANLDAAYGLTVNFAGEIIARTGISVHPAIKGLPTIHIKDGARIVTDETTGHAIDAGGNANWQIDAAELSGYAGLYALAGNLSLNGPEIYAEGPALILGDLTAPSASDNDNLAAARRRAAQGLRVTISSGDYLSRTGITIIGTPAVSELHIKNGNFCGPVGVINEDLAGIIYAEDGKFTTDVNAFGQDEPETDATDPVSIAMIDELSPACN